jgi:hypothetical protein
MIKVALRWMVMAMYLAAAGTMAGAADHVVAITDSSGTELLRLTASENGSWKASEKGKEYQITQKGEARYAFQGPDGLSWSAHLKAGKLKVKQRSQEVLALKMGAAKIKATRGGQAEPFVEFVSKDGKIKVRHGDKALGVIRYNADKNKLTVAATKGEVVAQCTGTSRVSAILGPLVLPPDTLSPELRVCMILFIFALDK